MTDCFKGSEPGTVGKSVLVLTVFYSWPTSVWTKNGEEVSRDINLLGKDKMRTNMKIQLHPSHLAMCVLVKDAKQQCFEMALSPAMTIEHCKAKG